MPTLTESACQVLGTADAGAKAALTREVAAAWRQGLLVGLGSSRPPERPARPARPRLVPPRELPRRRLGRDNRGRVALVHAVAHIELNAIDLAWDMIARFADEAGDERAAQDFADAHAFADAQAFADDWVGVADDEARHFTLLVGRLDQLGAAYGELPAHDGLWQAAAETRHDLLARLAVVPLVLEARGLDVTPGLCERLRRAGDEASARILELILDDEIGHVATGQRWFLKVCARRGLEPISAFHDLVRRHFRGTLKPPFNVSARRRAGLGQEFYLPLVG
ncbi:MAG: ferritin-like domain-containing protein [Alphaproteobacteria bacterium]